MGEIANKIMIYYRNLMKSPTLKWICIFFYSQGVKKMEYIESKPMLLERVACNLME